MNKSKLTAKEAIEVDRYPNYCYKCGRTEVTPTFDYEHDVINFHCENCGNDYSSDEFVECGYCHELIHSSTSIYSKRTKKDYCSIDYLVADNQKYNNV